MTGKIIKWGSFKWKEKYSDKFLLRLVLSYSVILIIILFLGVFMYSYGIRTARKKLIDENYKSLQNAVRDVDKSFQIMLSLNHQIANDSDVYSFVTSDNINTQFFLTVLDAKTNLTNLLSVQNLTFVEDLFVYAHNTDYILSANELENSSLYYHYNRRYDKNYYEHFMDRIKNPKYAGIPQQLNQYTSTRKDFLIYSYPMSMYRPGSKSNASICYGINKNYFENLFSDLSLYDTGFIYIADHEKEEILRITTKNSIDISSNDFITKVETAKNQNSIKLNNEDMIVSSYTSKNNQWTYYLVQPSSMVFSVLYHYQKLNLNMISGALFIGIVLLFIMSNNNLAPFKRIEHQLKGSLSDEEAVVHDKSNNVVNTIDHYVNALIHSKATLQQTIEWQRPIIYTSHLAKLMHGLIESEEELNRIKSIFNLKDKLHNYYILYINICLNELEVYIDNYVIKKGGYQDVIKGVFYTYFGDRINIYEVDSQSFSILIQWEQEEDKRSIMDLFEQVHVELRDKYSLIIYGGISEKYEDLLLTWKYYQHAVQALNYAGRNHILIPYEKVTHNMSSYYYPIELEQQLLNFITNGKMNQVEAVLTSIYYENFEVRSLSINMIKWLLSDLRNTLLKVRFSLPENDSNNIKLLELDEKFRQKKSFELIRLTAKELCQCFEKMSSQSVLIDRVKVYIQDNYMDSSLSLNKISEEFHISESYFSYLFKEITNQNFSEYLEKIRMKQAIHLLQTTSMNIEDISSDVGYNNTSSFRRAFKKLLKVTPQEVRGNNQTIIKQELL